MISVRKKVLLAVAVMDLVLGIVTVSSGVWIRYCTPPQCAKHAYTGVLFAETFCSHDILCVDTLQFGVFTMLCIALACRAWFASTLASAMYHDNQENMNHNVLLLVNLSTTVIAEYIFILVVVLKLNGDQRMNFSAVYWPFYTNLLTIFFVWAEKVLPRADVDPVLPTAKPHSHHHTYGNRSTHFSRHTSAVW